jgi:hypothetical protein
MLRTVFTATLPSNRRPSVACAYVAGMGLSARCLAMGIHGSIRTAVARFIPVNNTGVSCVVLYCKRHCGEAIRRPDYCYLAVCKSGGGGGES